jgi:hypothetical protein
MRRRILKETQTALVGVLKSLEQIRMTRHDDPRLVELKRDIRRTITPVDEQEENELSTAA